MTAVAGFKCDGGIVLGADTRETSSGTKFPRRKLIIYNKDWLKAGIAGACNNGSLVDGLIGKLVKRFDKEKPDSFPKLEKYVEQTVVEYHKKVVKVFPDNDYNKRIELLIALRPCGEQSLELWSADASALSEVSEWDVRGSGEILRFVAARLYRPNLSLAEGRLLCTHLLALAKNHVDGVGGDSHILVLTNDGKWAYEERLVETEFVERFFTEFDKQLSEIFLSSADTSVSGYDFEKRIQGFIEQITTLRSDYVKNFSSLHLSHAVSDPANCSDPYVKLPHGTFERFEGKKAVYKQTGASGVMSVSPSSSLQETPAGYVSFSASTSPSTSASPSSSGEEEQETDES